MRFAICDDNKVDIRYMQEVFRRTAPGHALDVYNDGENLLTAISDGVRYDLLFLDIIMPEQSGMEVARTLARIAPETSVVFLTDSNDYAVEAFSVKALHYVIKPLTDAALVECLHRLKERQHSRRRVHIISSSGIQQMIFADEIQYAQSNAHYYDLHLTDGTIMKARMTQSEIQETLGNSFLPISRGLVVNVEFIRQLGTRSCILKDGREILLSRKNQEAIHSAYAAYVFSQLSQR